MGLDRFCNFISKYINMDGLEELYIENNIRKIVSNNILFDLNFLIYQIIIDIENEVNDIIKIILTLPFSNYSIIEILINNILNLPHWQLYNNNIHNILDGNTEDDIIINFINFLSTYINLSDFNINKISYIELIIYEKIIHTIINYIDNLHDITLINNISIFFDGIPSLSKIIEQRRRRLKNYIESNEKKLLFKKYFGCLDNNNKKLIYSLNNTNIFKNINIDNLVFDYFKWIKYRFSIDKSIGPGSIFVNNLEIYLEIKLKQFLPKIKITINSSQINGESDMKIFKYIASNNVYNDYSIHTTDSDLIHLMLIQQTYYKIIDKDININVIRYCSNNNNNNTIKYVQYLDGNIIIKTILELYNNINNTKSNNYKLIWDLCLFFYLFGNDHLPSSLEIGPELGLEYFIKIHYESLNNDNIIDIKKKNIVMNINNLLIYLEKLYTINDNNITKIILNRYFRINSQLVTLFVDKFNLNFKELLVFLKNFIIFDGLNMNIEDFNKLDITDLRKIFINNIPENEINKYKDISIFNLTENNTILLKNFMNLLKDNIDYYEYNFNGLILYSKSINICNDKYQDLYNYISDKVFNNLSKTYPILYDYYDINYHLNILDNNISCNCNDYLKKIYHFIITQFGNMSSYHNDNLTYYKYNNAPKLKDIINFIKNIPPNINITDKWNNDINNDNIYDNYFNNISHNNIISPIIIIANNKKNNLDNLDYKNIDINIYLK